MKELRVAIFTGTYNHLKDGVSLTLNRWVQFLLDHDVPVLVFGPTVENPAIDHAGRLVSVPSIRMPVSGRGEYRVPIGLSTKSKEELEAFDPTLVHIATPDGAGYKALKWARNKGIQVVSSYHTHFTSYFKYYGLTPVKFLSWRYLSWFYNSTTHIYVPSQSMIDELKRHGFDKGLKIWARGVDTSLFSPEKIDMEWRRKAGFEDDDIVVTFVSRLVWEKELETFRHSVQQVSSTNPRVKAMVVGDGPAKDEFQKRIPEAHFTGFLNGEDLARAYASSDIFLFPSHTETFGNVTLEAMSSGLPCLVADATGSKSLVEHNVNGALAESENKGDFTKKLAIIASDEELRSRMRKASREKALEYEWDEINGQLLKYYKEALELPPPHPDI